MNYFPTIVSFEAQLAKVRHLAWEISRVHA